MCAWAKETLVEDFQLTTILDCVNDMLATMGEAPLNQLDEDHPYVAAGVRYVSSTNKKVQGSGWWFNTETLRLTPDPESGFIYVPNDILTAEGLRGQTGIPACRYEYTLRGRRLYDLTNGTYEIAENPVYLKVIREVPFEDLPPTAQDAIGITAVLRFQMNYDGDRQKLEELKVDQNASWQTLKAEHIRQVRANFLNSPSAAAKIVAVSPLGSSRLPYFGRTR